MHQAAMPVRIRFAFAEGFRFSLKSPIDVGACTQQGKLQQTSEKQMGHCAEVPYARLSAITKRARAHTCSAAVFYRS